MTDEYHEVSDNESVDERYDRVLYIDEVGMLTFFITFLPLSDKYQYYNW